MLKVVDIDYFEQDGILFDDESGKRIYFQWDGKKEPTVQDAILFILKDDFRARTKYGR